MIIIFSPLGTLIDYGEDTIQFGSTVGGTVDAGSSISGGTFTEGGWRPVDVKWSRRRHEAFMESVRDEARSKLAEERQLTAIGRAERDMRAAQEECDTCNAEFNKNATRANHAKHTAAQEKLTAAQDKVNEMRSVEYIEKLWADYHADQEAKKAKRNRS